MRSAIHSPSSRNGYPKSESSSEASADKSQRDKSQRPAQILESSAPTTAREGAHLPACGTRSPYAQVCAGIRCYPLDVICKNNVDAITMVFGREFGRIPFDANSEKSTELQIPIPRYPRVDPLYAPVSELDQLGRFGVVLIRPIPPRRTPLRKRATRSRICSEAKTHFRESKRIPCVTFADRTKRVSHSRF